MKHEEEERAPEVGREYRRAEGGAGTLVVMEVGAKEVRGVVVEREGAEPVMYTASPAAFRLLWK